MKHYLFRNIIINIFRKSKESLLICLLVFLVCTFLTVSLFFTQSEQLEESLIREIPLDIEIYNTHYFNDKFIKTPYPVSTQLYLREYHFFLNELEEFSQNREITYFNFDIELSGRQYDMQGNPDKYVTLGGINDSSYLTRSELEFLEGRNFTDDEISGCEGKVIVSDQATVSDKGGIRPVRLGDVLHFVETDGYEITRFYEYVDGEEIITESILNPDGKPKEYDLEVIGIYSLNYKYDYSNGKEDDFYNKSVYYVPYGLLRNIICDLSCFIFLPRINHITFSADTLDSYLSLNSKMNDFIGRMENHMNASDIADEINLVRKENNVAGVVVSVSRIKAVYSTVFTISLCITISAFFFVLFYLQSHKAIEISIYFSLGQKRSLITLQYLIMYSLIALAAIIPGLPAGYGISKLLIRRILEDTLATQGKLLRYANNGTLFKDIQSIQLIAMDKGKMLTALLASLSGVYLVITLSTIIIMTYVLHGNNLRAKLAGDNL